MRLCDWAYIDSMSDSLAEGEGSIIGFNAGVVGELLGQGSPQVLIQRRHISQRPNVSAHCY